jgi:hypothetical protein
MIVYDVPPPRARLTLHCRRVTMPHIVWQRDRRQTGAIMLTDKCGRQIWDSVMM